MDKVSFWKRPPRPLFQDLRAWSLFVPAILSAIGLSVFAVFGFSFTALPSLDDAVLNRAVVFGGLCLAIGGELGTFASSIEVFRKRAGGQAVLLDYAGLVVSLLATYAEFAIAHASLAAIERGWTVFFERDGALLLVALSALDAYATFMEAGFYLNSYDQRMESWQRSYERFARGEYLSKASSEPAIASEAASSEQAAASDERYECPYCERVFGSQAGLNAHQRVHTARSNGSEPAHEPVAASKGAL